jgi:hypothetical protein
MFDFVGSGKLVQKFWNGAGHINAYAHTHVCKHVHTHTHTHTESERGIYNLTSLLSS